MQPHKSFIEYENENTIQVIGEDDKRPQPSTCKKILRDRKTRAFAFFVIFALTVPVLVFFFVIDQSSHAEPDNSYTCLVGFPYRVACGRVNITKVECGLIHCCYDNETSGCYHSIPSRYTYYKCNDSILELNRYCSSKPYTPFLRQALPELKLSVVEIDASKLKIILHADEIPYKERNDLNKAYHVKWANHTLGVEVFRAETAQPLLTTLRGPLIASDGYWEWSFQLTNEKLFGLGELLLEENKTVSKVIYKNRNDHNTLPSFMALLNGHFHGVVVEHDGPLEVTVLPSRLVVLKTLAGNKIVLNLCTGPKPKDVVKQQRLYNPSPLPYWALGAHICRDGKTTIESAIEEYKKFTENQGKIEFASDCIHENLYTMLNDVNEEHDLANLIKDLQAKSHFLMSVPPQILKENFHLYNKAVELKLLYKDKQGEILKGSYLEQEVAYPDFTHDSISTWIQELSASLPASRVDGFVLRDNWPEEESYVFSDEDRKFPYLTQVVNSSMSGTIPWNALGTNGISEMEHILKHNQYGASQVKAFKDNLNFDFLMTSSYDYGVEDAALVQNINISWSNLKKGITTTLYHSIFGNPLISIPVCGSTDNYNKETHEKLCIRWYLVAATLPLFRVSSDFPRRDPSSLATGFAQNIAFDALEKRYMLLPYYYSILSGEEPLVRPMFYDFYFDNETLSLDEQYMLGNALLISQPLLPEASNLRVYLPPSVGSWYEFWGGAKYEESGWINIHIVEADWIMFVAAGHVVPLRNYKLPKVGSDSQDDTFTLAVALNCTSSSCFAEGSLKLDSTSLTFSATEKGLTVRNVVQAGSDLGCNLAQRIWPHFIENVKIYGLAETAVSSNFPSIDLCKVTSDEIYVEYFNKKYV